MADTHIRVCTRASFIIYSNFQIHDLLQCTVSRARDRLVRIRNEKKGGARIFPSPGRTTPTRPTNGRSAGPPQPTATCRDLAWAEDQYALCVTSRGGPSRDSPRVSRRVRRSCQIVCPRASIACRNCNFRPIRAGGAGRGPQSQFRIRSGARDSRSVYGQHPTIRTRTPG